MIVEKYKAEYASEIMKTIPYGQFIKIILKNKLNSLYKKYNMKRSTKITDLSK